MKLVRAKVAADPRLYDALARSVGGLGDELFRGVTKKLAGSFDAGPMRRLWMTRPERGSGTKSGELQGVTFGELKIKWENLDQALEMLERIREGRVILEPVGVATNKPIGQLRGGSIASENEVLII